MIQVYLAQDRLAMCKAMQVYPDGREPRRVDFKYRSDGVTPDDSDTGCHKSIIARWQAGEKIQEIPWPNEVYPDPDAPKSPEDIRAERYKQEADPLLLAALGYGVELEAKPGDAALLQKQAQAKADYLAAKTKIRNEVKDA